MVADNDGYLWIATEEGLVRFDGASFSVYNESNVHGLYSSSFIDISLSGATLWASSRNTILRIVKNKIQTIDFRSYLTNAWIKSIEADAQGRLWIGTSAGILYYLENNQVVKWQGAEQGRNGSIDVMRAVGNSVLIGTSKGLFQIEGQQARLKQYPRFSGLPITALAVGVGQQLWVGTAEEGLFLLSGGTEALHLTEKQGLKEPYINSLSIGESGAVWIGTRSSGFQLYESGVVSSPQQDRFASDGIRTILHTGERITWMGTNSSGLVQIKPAQIQMFTLDKALAESIILPIYQHSNGDVWVGTAGKGVNRLINDQKTTLTKEQGLSNNLVLSIAGTEDYIFIGTANGLDRFNLTSGKIDRHFTKNDGLINNSIQALLYDSKKRLWVATRGGGLHIVNGEKVEKISLPVELSSTGFPAVFEDRQGNIWFGSRGGGMVQFDIHSRFTHFNQSKGFNADIVYSFFEDGMGGLWMATDKGLYSYYKGQFLLFDKKAGLKFNEVYRLLEDNNGFLWLSGNFGLQRIKLAELQQYRKEGIKGRTLSVRLFNTIDGMANAEANGGFSPAGWKMKDGNLWFPTVQGIAIVEPQLISEKSHPVTLQLHTFRYGSKELSADEKITVPAGTNAIEISYSSIDFSKAEDINFYYRLKGLSDEWKPVGNRKVAYYEGLRHGSYTFEVRAEQYGQWSPIAAMTFSIAPFFYQSAWFKGGVVLLGAGLICLMVYIQRKKEKEKLLVAKNMVKAQIVGQEKERQVIGVELHDNINQQLATVKLYLDFARSSEEGRMAMIERSEKVVKGVIDEIRALCKTLTPPTLKDIGLSEALQELVESYTIVEKLNVQYTCTASLNTLEEELQFSIFRMLQEALQNIDKHAQAGNAWIDIHEKEGSITILVKDDGCGYDVKQASKGAGFRNIRNRLEVYNGHMEAHSKPGTGSAIYIKLPLTGMTR